MRLLLIDDHNRLSELELLIPNIIEDRIPCRSKQKFKIYNSFDSRDLEAEVLMSKMRGNDLTERGLIRYKINHYNLEYVPDTISFSNDGNRINASCDVYPANPEFLTTFRELKYLKHLESKASQMIVDIAKEAGVKDIDFRRFYLNDSGVYYGNKTPNLEDARLFGGVEGGELIISYHSYEINLVNLKK